MPDPWTAADSLWDLWLITWIVAAAWSSRAAARASFFAQWPPLVVAGGGLGLLFAQWDGSPFILVRLWRTPTALAWVGVAATAAGFALCWWARLHLGRLWSAAVTRKADHRIVATGPYGLVRHPIYAGLLLAAASLAMMDGTAGALLGLAVFTTGLAWKARSEEAFLKQQLGAEAYAAYARRVPMLAPLPWWRGETP